MDFGFTRDQESFREGVTDFLRKNPAEKFSVQYKDDGYGFGSWSYDFSRLLGTAGWLTLSWPKEYGGQGRSIIDKLILQEELSYKHSPWCANYFADSMVDTIMEQCSNELKSELLPKIARGEGHFWLAFSEPDAGTDLLAINTIAKEDGDYYVLNGQKVWSSYAHLADYGYLLARTETDPDARRSQTLSIFILDKKLPGVTLRPLTSLANTHIHNEVYMDNVKVHKKYLVGEKNKGFNQMLRGLESDRFWARFVKAPWCKRLLEDLVQYAKETKRRGKTLAEDSLTRYRLAEMAMEIEACRLLFWRMAWMLNEGLSLTYEASEGKVFADEMGQRLFSLGMQMFGLYSQLEGDSKWAPLKGMVEKWYLESFGHVLAGGTSEIQRTSIATVGMGLPRR